MTVRLDFIVLILEVLKLQNLIDISWLTLILLMTIPYILGIFLTRYLKSLTYRGITKLGPITITQTKRQK